MRTQGEHLLPGPLQQAMLLQVASDCNDVQKYRNE
jgi:hypothetical protein